MAKYDSPHFSFCIYSCYLLDFIIFAYVLASKNRHNEVLLNHLLQQI